MKSARFISRILTSLLALLSLFFVLGLARPAAVQAEGESRPVEESSLTGGEYSPKDSPLAYLSAALSISGGYYHTCALISGGSVRCWGDNDFGQLGSGSFAGSLVPVPVQGISSGATAVAAGTWHTCAIAEGGAVRCWGRNSDGQLGNNSDENSSTPVEVSGLSSGAIAITAGASHTCALLNTGAVKCWGWNYYGQLGNNSTVDSPIPVDVSGLTSGVTSISAGGSHTCAVSSGAAVCWGGNGTGQLGDDSFDDKDIPVTVSGLSSGVNAVSAGSWHSCALTSSGAAWCWGNNYFGQLGNASIIDSPVPVAVSSLSSGVSAITGGEYHTCAAASGGAARCWGDNGFGQLGNNSDEGSSVPVDVSGLSSGVSAVGAGIYHTCAVGSGGSPWCWGMNSFGQLGDGTTEDRLTPVQVSDGVIAPVLSAVFPPAYQAGSSGASLTITGTGFLDGAVAYWNGAVRTTSFVSSTQLSAAITAADLVSVAVNQVTVVNPGPSAPSNALQVSVHTFADSTPTDWYWKWVEGLYAKRITGGCDINPFRYCPDRVVTRAEMAVFILKAQNEDVPGYAPDPAQTGIFADVPVVGKEWMQAWIEEFYEQGITGGCDVNPFRYCPERQVTRAEMSVFILRAVHGAGYTPPAATGIFADVPVAGKEWMQPWIEQFYREGITGGCDTAPLRFCPERQVTRAEMAAFIDRAFGFPQVP